MSRSGKQGSGREPDERLAAFVDGCLTEREHDRFIAELRVSPQLRQDLDEYERTVAIVQRALRAPTAPVSVADAVMARLASAESASAVVMARPARSYRLAISVLAAAAMLMLAIWINSWPAGRGARDALRTDTVADGPRAELPVRFSAPDEEAGALAPQSEAAKAEIQRDKSGAAEGAARSVYDTSTLDRKDGAKDGKNEGVGNGPRDTVPGEAASAQSMLQSATPETATPEGDLRVSMSESIVPPSGAPARAEQSENKVAGVAAKPQQDPETRTSTGSDDFYLGAARGAETENLAVRPRFGALQQRTALAETEIAALPYLRVTRYRASSALQELSEKAAQPQGLGRVSERGALPGSSERGSPEPGLEFRPTAPTGPATPAPSGPATGGPSGPGSIGPKSPGSSSSPSAAIPPPPAAGGQRKRAFRDGTGDTLALFIKEQLEVAPQAWAVDEPRDALQAERLPLALGDVRFVDFTATVAADRDRIEGNDEPSVGESFWLVEGPRAAVAAAMRRIAELAQTAGDELGNGEVRVPRAGLAAVTANDIAANETAADTKPTEPVRNPESAQIVLRFRTIAKPK